MGKLPDLKIGDILINPPIIQGGMGVRVSFSNLVSTVSNTGALGVLACVGLGEELSTDGDLPYEERSDLALKDAINLIRKKTRNAFGANIMTALTNYDRLVKVCVTMGVPIIFSGAGLPLKLPALVAGTETKIVPIISSSRAAEVICKVWSKKYKRLPDAIVIEGPLAGGHLGYDPKFIAKANKLTLLKLLTDVKMTIRSFENDHDIPVIVGGGIFTGKDIAECLHAGAAGVQMATRFIATNECDASEKFKFAVLNSKKEDIVIVNSPVGLPGRVIKNEFVEKILTGKKIKFECDYKCLKTCDSENTNYCIAKALVNAYRGNLKAGFVMAGANCYRVNKILSVRELIDEVVGEAEANY